MKTETKYKIKVKQDFGNGNGFWLPCAGNHGSAKYGWVKSGFIVTDGFCNIMPGATWFRTIPDAMSALHALIECDFDASKFWTAVRVRNDPRPVGEQI